MHCLHFISYISFWTYTDNTGLLPGWNLQSVLILSGSFKAYNFPINRWLSKKKGDRHTVIHSTRCAPQSPFFVTKQEDEFASPDERPNYVDRLLHPHLQNSRHRTNKHSKDHASGRHTGSKEYEKASSSSSSAIGEDEEKELDDSLAVNIPHPHKSNGNDDSLQTKIADALLAQNEYAN